MRALVGACLAMFCVSCATTQTTFEAHDNGHWSERCVRLTDLVRAPLDDQGFRFVHIFWPAPSKGSITLYAAMSMEPFDDAAPIFYNGDDEVGGVAQITHYVGMPEVAELFADCLLWSGRFTRKSRVATSNKDGWPEEFSAIYVERSSGKKVAIETMHDTVGLLVSDRLEGEVLRAALRDRMKTLFEDVHDDDQQSDTVQNGSGVQQ